MTKLRQTILDNAMHKTRIDCPKCGGSLCLSITKQAGVIKYNCFKARCGVRGAIEQGRTKEEIKQGLTNPTNHVIPKAKQFVLPDYIIQGPGTMEATNWARQNNVIQAYENKLINLTYDPRENRLLFELRDYQLPKIVGAVGRGMVGTKEKWKVYDNSQPHTPFKCGKGNILVIVEDCASACSVSRVKDCVGMALLGTNFHGGYVPYIRGYEQYIICLDNDAKVKAVNLLLKRMELLTNRPVHMMFTKEDLKKLDILELEEMIGHATSC